MTNTRYGVNESRKLFCKKHQEFHPSNERCRWCPVAVHYSYDYVHENHDYADPGCYLCGGTGSYHSPVYKTAVDCFCVTHFVGFP